MPNDSLAERRAPVPEQVLAVLCDGSTAGSVTTNRFFVTEGPVVLISMTISSMASSSQISKTVEQQLVAGVASSLGISSYLVKLDAVKDIGRRLLALFITFRLLAAHAVEATELQDKAQKVDMQVLHTCLNLFFTNIFAYVLKCVYVQAAMERQGLRVSVSGITAEVMTPSGSGSTGSGGVSLGPMLGAAVAGAVGGICLAGVTLFMYRRYRRYRRNSITSPHDPSSQFVSSASSSYSS
jgi:hypothetical protein